MLSLLQTAQMKKSLEYSWMNLGDISEVKAKDIFSFYRASEPEKTCFEMLKLFANPEYFYFTVKHIFNIELLPFQCVVLKELWYRPFPMLIASRGGSKTFLLSLYAMLRSFLRPGRKIVVVGGAFRQSKYLFEYCKTMWDNAPLLRDIVGMSTKEVMSTSTDRCVVRLGESRIIFLPLGDGSKIRGERANDIIGDEFASINPDIYENVVAGFASVSQTPVENVKTRSKIKAMKDMGFDMSAVQDSIKAVGNQAIISGTADYDFRHFAKYWRRYKDIVLSKGDPNRLEEIFEGEVPEAFDWRDYSVIRIPVELIPKGFMDERHIARSKATIDIGIYAMEYGAVFSKDSHGFFKGSLIESCTTNKVVVIGNGEKIQFEAMNMGNFGKTYIYGIDPASERDNFAIVIVEVNGSHRRLVYAWTTTRKRHRIQLKTGITSESDYYSFCVRKIRNLMRVFPCTRMAIDAGGGGIAIEEGLHDKDKLHDGEKPIWQIIEDDDEKDTDHEPGLHILEMINFSNYEWLGHANHGMKKDMQDKMLLFPRFDSVTLGIMAESDKDGYEDDRIYDTLEDCALEIEELKQELATIKITQTPTGRDKWSTPEVKEPGGTKIPLRKDRYTALLIANMSARCMDHVFAYPQYNVVGGVASELKKKETTGRLYVGPEWYNPTANSFGNVIRK